MKKTSLFVLCLLFLLSPSYAEEYHYVGSHVCKWCHGGIKKGAVYEKWKKGPHARAFESLKAAGQEKNPQCLECHTTGFNTGGYRVNDYINEIFAGVGCESCHGPGSGYKPMAYMKDKEISLDHGLIEPTEEVCKKCHNEKSPTYKGFNYKEAVEKIDHTYRIK